MGNRYTLGTGLDGANREEKKKEEARYAFRAGQWAEKECFKMYGEYLTNLAQPYPAELVEKYRASLSQKEPQ